MIKWTLAETKRDLLRKGYELWPIIWGIGFGFWFWNSEIFSFFNSYVLNSHFGFEGLGLDFDFEIAKFSVRFNFVNSYVLNGHFGWKNYEFGQKRKWEI